MKNDNLVLFNQKRKSKKGEDEGLLPFTKVNNRYIWATKNVRATFIVDLNIKLIENLIKKDIKYGNNNLYLNEKETIKISELAPFLKIEIDEILKNYTIFDKTKEKAIQVDLTYLWRCGEIDFKKDIVDKCVQRFNEAFKPMLQINQKVFKTKHEITKEFEKIFYQYYKEEELEQFLQDADLYDEDYWGAFLNSRVNSIAYFKEIGEEYDDYEDLIEFLDIKQWLNLFQEKKPVQYAFFLRLFIDHMFNLAAYNKDHPFNKIIYNRKIRLALGGNRSGKGTLANLLQLIPNCTEITQANVQSAIQEYKKIEIFPDNTSLVVDGEFKLETKTDASIINEFKKGLRVGETNTVRKLSKDAIQIDFKGTHFICVNPPTTNDQIALKMAYNYFADWVAYDRFDIVFVDWSTDQELWSKFEYLKNVIENGTPNIRNAIGSLLAIELIKRVWVINESYDHKYEEEIIKQALCKEYYQTQVIPKDFQVSKQFDNLKQVDKKIKNIMELFLKYQTQFNQLVEGETDKLSEISKNLKIELVSKGYKSDAVNINKYLNGFYDIKKKTFYIPENSMLMLLNNQWKVDITVMKNYLKPIIIEGVKQFEFNIEKYKKDRGYV